ncbi:MAG TPA: hypothetical protein ENI23_09960 [bacterium]|nr:hypothetical protein [bacterium]
MVKSQKVSWKTIAPILGDVLVSPWNLLIGGLLVSTVSFPTALISILLGYLVLGLIFYYYGGLGHKFNKKTSELLEPVFGKKGVKTFFSAILALGQIGWFAIISQIGGESLSHILGSPYFVGIIIYAILMFLIASLDLHKLAIVKVLITASSIALIIYLVTINFSNINIQQLFATGFDGSLLWGTSIVVTSMISFSSVSPDFFSQLQKKKDVWISILLGIFIPGIIIATLGAILFSFQSVLSIDAVIGLSSFALLGHVFNIITNTDAAQAIYTPGNRFSYMLSLPFVISVGIAAAIGTVFSLLNIRSQLEIWLSVLAGIYPAIIGVTIARYTLHHFKKKKAAHISSTDWNAITIVLFSSILIFIVNISLLGWIVGFTSFLFYILMTGVTIKIYIGEES